MNRTWVSLLFLSVSWLLAVPVFTPPQPRLWAVFVVVSLLLNISAFRKAGLSRFDGQYAVLLLPALISAVFLPYPYNVGPLLLLIGISFGLLHRRTSAIGAGLALSGIMMLAQSALIPLYFMFTSRCHLAALFAAPANFLFKITGLDTVLSKGTVFAQTGTQVAAISVTWEKLGLLPLLGIMAGGIALLLISGTGRRKIPAFFLALIAFMLARFVFLTLLYLDNNKISLFWAPVATLLTFAPFIPVLMKFFPLPEPPSLAPFRLDRSFRRTAGLGFLALLALCGAWGYFDPGNPKPGRVIIDEKHSNWEWTTREFDTGWYGEKSGYNYYSLYQYLSLHYKVSRNTGPITEDVLSDCDVLIVKTPTEPFSPQEIECIKQFVKNGGGLFLVGDHTNVFGTGTYLNAIAGQFGLRFRYDATYELSSGSLSEYDRPAVLPHPIVQNMPHFLFATSCTLEAPLRADAVITGYRLKALAADYSQKNFFPTEMETPNMDTGLFLQAAAVYYGKGRVCAFTDSTVFSNFWMFMPGKPELALGSVEWLNRSNKPAGFKQVMLFIGLVLILAVIYSFFTAGTRCAVVAVLFSCLIALPVAIHGCGALNRLNYQPPKPHTGFTRVCFEQEHSDFSLPTTVKDFMAGYKRSYLTFYVWNQRLGYIPRLEQSLQKALLEGDIVVIINPNKPLREKEKTDVKEFVRRGGKLLVLDSVANQKSTANELLQDFGMTIDFKPLSRSTAQYGEGREIAVTPQACRVYGGRPLIRNQQGESVCSVARDGQGAVAVFADAGLFANSSLGDTGSVPDKYQKEITELEFWLMRSLANNDFGEE